MNEYKYLFSVVMPVYKVETYLRESIESLIHQTIGFSNIQLILVDDGSPDNSGAICDEYKERYPENIVVVHKENGGVSSARNEGLRHAEGKYLNFLDSDDKMSLDAFQKVADFFAAHEGETDVVCIPLQYFDMLKGSHRQNKKFELGKRVIDLYEHPHVLNMFTNSSFFAIESTKGILFDTRLTLAEDAKYALGVLFQKMKLGLVPDTVYWYRQRSSGEASAIQSQHTKVTNYLPYLRHFSNHALDTAAEKFGTVPKFVQYEVLHDLQWKMLLRQIPVGVLSPDEKENYLDMLIKTACRIDDDVILAQPVLPPNLKAYILGKKRALAPSASEACEDIPSFGLRCRNKVGATLAAWDFFTVSEDGKNCILEGYHELYGIDPADVEPYLIVNGETIPCERVERPKANYNFFGKKIGKTIGFRATLPLDNQTLTVSPALRCDGKVIQQNNIVYNQFFPVTDTYKNAYALTGGRLLTLSGRQLLVQKKPNIASRIAKEARFLLEVLKKNPSSRAQALGRLAYDICRPFKRRKLWLISDNYIKADDNGEALFRHIRQAKPKNVRPVYVISKKSADYKRMTEIGKCVDAFSRRHKLMFLLCDMNISSHANDTTINPFGRHFDIVRDLMVNNSYVFLQHGIIKDDLSDWLERYNRNIDGFVTAAGAEYRSIVHGNYDYPEDTIWLTGLPRYDRLRRDDKKWITVMPTWRKYLMDTYRKGSGTYDLIDRFEEQPFFRFYNELLNSTRLLDGLEKYGYALKFMPHPRIMANIDRFTRDPRVEFFTKATSYNAVYAASSLIVTDYSSAVFDFAYLREPVVYCHFDKDEFFSGNHAYSEGYFDYERDGFGEVTYDIEQLIDTILEYAANGCTLKEKYLERIDGFFAFNDQANCRRVLDKILALSAKH